LEKSHAVVAKPLCLPLLTITAEENFKNQLAERLLSICKDRAAFLLQHIFTKATTCVSIRTASVAKLRAHEQLDKCFMSTKHSAEVLLNTTYYSTEAAHEFVLPACALCANAFWAYWVLLPTVPSAHHRGAALSVQLPLLLQ
jgi:hypothetical protein